MKNKLSITVLTFLFAGFCYGADYKPSEREVKLKEVAAKSEQIIHNVDKMIVLPTEQQIKMSTSSLELLNVLHLPGLNVDLINQKADIGGLPPVYQINGRPQTRKQIAGINPDDILKIEYSPAASIRYLNQGTGGLINFILKERNAGGDLYANALASPISGFVNGTLNAGINIKKSEFRILYSNNWLDYTKSISGINECFNELLNQKEYTSEGINSPFGYLKQQADLSYTYQPDFKTMFSVSFRNSINSQDMTSNGFDKQTIYSEGTPYSDLWRHNKVEFSNYIPSLDLYFNKGFAHNQSIELNVVGTLQNSDYNNIISDYLNGSDYRYYKSEVDNSQKSLIAEANYKKSFKSIELGFGVSHMQSFTKNEYLNITYSTQISDNIILLPDPGKDRKTQTISDVNSGDTYLYGEIEGNIEKLSYTFGSGLKYFSVNKKYYSNKTYTRNSTTLNLLYPFGDLVKVSYLCQFTPTLPSLSELSSVSQQYDSLLVIKGNPELKPSNSIKNRLLLTLSKDKYKANLWMSHIKSYNPISLNTYSQDYNQSASTFPFIAQLLIPKYTEQLNAQLDLSGNAIFNHLNASLTTGWNKFCSTGKDYSVSLDKFYWSFMLQGYYKDFNLQVEYAKPQKQLYNEIITLTENYSLVMLTYKKGNFGCQAGVYYPLANSSKYGSTSLSANNPDVERSYVKDNRHMFMLGLTYQLGYGSNSKKNAMSFRNTDTENGILQVQKIQ